MRLVGYHRWLPQETGGHLRAHGLPEGLWAPGCQSSWATTGLVGLPQGLRSTMVNVGYQPTTEFVGYHEVVGYSSVCGLVQGWSCGTCIYPGDEPSDQSTINSDIDILLKH